MRSLKPVGSRACGLEEQVLTSWVWVRLNKVSIDFSYSRGLQFQSDN